MIELIKTILIISAPYFITAFTLLEINPVNMSTETRFLIALFTLVLLLLRVMYLLTVKDIERHKLNELIR